MFSIKVGLFFVLLTIFFSNGSTEYKEGTKAAPVIYDGSSISFLNKGEENIKIHTDDWEPTDFGQKGVKRDVAEDYEEQYIEEYIEQYHPLNTEISSWTMLYQWIIVGIFFGMIMCCCFGKITFWTWLSDTRSKRMKRLNRMPRTSKLHVSKPAPRSTLLAVESAIYIVTSPSKSAAESITSTTENSTRIETFTNPTENNTGIETFTNPTENNTGIEIFTSTTENSTRIETFTNPTENNTGIEIFTSTTENSTGIETFTGTIESITSPPQPSSEQIELEPIAGTSSQY